jgi:hypothetical protein
MTDSPSLSTKPAPLIRGDKQIKLSPSALSPGYQLFEEDEEYNHSRYNPPMKHKDPTSTLQISTADSSFPVSPYTCSSPYWGSFGVSATSGSGRTSATSPSLQPSPNMNSASGRSSSSHPSHQDTPPKSATSYRSQNQAPILIAPNPMSLRPATKQEKGPYRQNSLQSNQSMSSSHGPPQGAFPGSLDSNPAVHSKKRKTPPRSAHEDLLFSSDMTNEERILMELTDRDQLQWKEVAARFNEATGKSMKVPALQMRKKRLVERLRVWTDKEVAPLLQNSSVSLLTHSQERALTLACENYEKGKWENIAKDMLNHGCDNKWTKEAVQRKWHEMHPEEGDCTPEYEVDPRGHPRMSSDMGLGQGSLSEGRGSISHSLHDGETSTLLSAISPVTMDEVRSRAARDASTHLYIRQQQQQHHHQQQHQMMLEQQQHHQQQQQQQRNAWGPGV